MTDWMKSYWNKRYVGGRIWGDEACPSAMMAGDWFHKFELKDVLVPGCGYGRNSLLLANEGFHVTAFDVSDTAVELAVEKAKGESLDVEYLVGDAFDDSFLSSRQFDGLFLSNVLHLFLAHERKRLLQRLTALIQPHGIFAFSCISVFDSNNYGIGPEIEPNTFVKHEGKPMHFFTEEELHGVLSNDFKVLECKIHTQTETDPKGESEDLQLWFVVAQKL